MSRKIFQVDSFTNEPFKGNPAGVMILDKSISDEEMQQIAFEMNLSETAFVLREGNNFNIRYFTPTQEVPMCGHATLASAHVMYNTAVVDASQSILFKAKGGELLVCKEDDFIVMNYPFYPLTKISIQKDFVGLIGFEPVEIYSSLYGWVVLLAKSEEEIRKATPKFELLTEYGLGCVMISSQSEMEDTDFVLRCFAPIAGINEDPVTGSAHCALTPLWASKLNKTELNSFQLSERTGKLITRFVGDRVEIRGQAVIMFEAVWKA